MADCTRLSIADRQIFRSRLLREVGGMALGITFMFVAAQVDFALAIGAAGAAVSAVTGFVGIVLFLRSAGHRIEDYIEKSAITKIEY